MEGEIFKAGAKPPVTGPVTDTVTVTKEKRSPGPPEAAFFVFTDIAVYIVVQQRFAARHVTYAGFLHFAWNSVTYLPSSTSSHSVWSREIRPAARLRMSIADCFLVKKALLHRPTW